MTVSDELIHLVGFEWVLTVFLLLLFVLILFLSLFCGLWLLASGLILLDLDLGAEVGQVLVSFFDDVLQTLIFALLEEVQVDIEFVLPQGHETSFFELVLFLLFLFLHPVEAVLGVIGVFLEFGVFLLVEVEVVLTMKHQFLHELAVSGTFAGLLATAHLLLESLKRLAFLGILC